jgi:hypothetical protein
LKKRAYRSKNFLTLGDKPMNGSRIAQILMPVFSAELRRK